MFLAGPGHQGLLFWRSCGGDNCQTTFGVCLKLFPKLWQRLFAQLFGKDRQQGTAHDGQVGQQCGLTGPGPVFAHQDVASPVIADFHPTPMAPDQIQPLMGGVLSWWRTGEVVTGLGGGAPVPFLGAVAPYSDQGAGKGEVGGEGLDGKGMELPGVDAAVTGVAVGKKGVFGKASKPAACLSKLGWLPLIWNR